MAESAVLRKQVHTAIEQARRHATARRVRISEAETAWAAFLTDVAVPAVRQLANVLRAEGIPFDVQTPSAAVHLVPDRHRDDRIELELDTTGEMPTPMLIVRLTRGGRHTRVERPLAAGVDIGAMTEDLVIAELLAALTPWLE